MAVPPVDFKIQSFLKIRQRHVKILLRLCIKRKIVKEKVTTRSRVQRLEKFKTQMFFRFVYI